GPVAIGLDTSVVLRLLLGEPRRQMEAARRRIEKALRSGEPVVVSDLVLAEVFHALRHHYGVPEAQALIQLRALIESRLVQLDPVDALPALDPRAGTGVVDRLIVARHRALGAITATFDRRQAGLEGGVLLRA